MGPYGVMGAVGADARLARLRYTNRQGRRQRSGRSIDLDVCSTVRERAPALQVPDQRSVVLVDEPGGRLLGTHPAQLVDLVAGAELAAQRGHRPPADELRPSLAIAIARGNELLTQLAPQPGLLLDLAQGRALPRLAPIQLALRERPVVVARPVDHGDLRAAGAVANDHAPGRPNLDPAIELA